MVVSANRGSVQRDAVLGTGNDRIHAARGIEPASANRFPRARVECVVMATEAVELIPAHLWTCPDCATDHFVRCVTLELSTEDRDELRSEMGIEPWEDGVFLMAPKRVTCPDCGRQFETIEFQAS